MSTQTHGYIPTWTLGDRLTKARNLTGQTVKEFAVTIGVSPKTINNYEGEAVKPRPIVLNAWALATGVDREWLKHGNVPPSGGGDSDSERTDDTVLYPRPMLSAVA